MYSTHTHTILLGSQTFLALHLTSHGIRYLCTSDSLEHVKLRIYIYYSTVYILWVMLNSEFIFITVQCILWVMLNSEFILSYTSQVGS